MANGERYTPSKPAAYLFLALFAITLIPQLIQVFRKRAWFMLVLAFATGMQVLGYLTRVLGVHGNRKAANIISQTMLVTSPAFFAAQDYMIVGRIIAYVGGNLSLIRDTWITKIFVIADILTIFTQVVGVVILTGADSVSAMQRARGILLAGLSLQVVTFAIFLVVAAHFFIKSRQVKGADIVRPLRPLFFAVFITGGLIVGRSIYRTIEFGSISFVKGERSGYLILHEWPFYVFDSVPMVLSTYLLTFYYPTNYLPRRKGLLIDGSEAEAPQRSTSWFGMGMRREAA